MAFRSSGKPKNTKGSSKTAASSFDKVSAVRMVTVPVTGAGVIAFPDDVTGAKRVWIEWKPSAAVTGKNRRMFLGKDGVDDPLTILTDGGYQVPRRGMSCDLEGRLGIVFGSGKIKIWVQSQRREAQIAPTVRELPTQLLSLVAPSDQE